ncbi:MAG: FHA domain-containing protein [Pseudomonadota bacterium]
MSADIGSTFTIFIETGLHAGTVQRLTPGMYTLGSELDADIILSDQDVKPVHLIMELDQGGIRLEPLQGDIIIEGEQAALEPGGERFANAPLTFAIGDTTINVSAPADAQRTRRRTRLLVGVAAMLIAVVMGFQVIGAFNAPDLDVSTAMSGAKTDTRDNAGPNGKGASISRTMNALEEQRQLALASDAAAPTIGEATLDQAVTELQDRLTAADLLDIAVRTEGGRIVVRGEAEPERMADWQQVRIWFDGTFSRNFLLDAIVEPAVAVEPPKLAIEAIWSGDKPYLIAGGKRFFIGHQIGDGWMIEHIASNEIVFKRGDKSFSLAL